ncbi:MAG: hypothetical protein JSU68_13610 [Phycisphaerales bacterium]|nr:MAG: hypothetical protein JSU68_13610 [Phycisphaerales bacterium]
MKAFVRCMMCLISVSLIGGCEGFDLGGLLGSSRVTVELVNNGNLPVQVEIYIADEQLIPEALLTSVGEKIEITVDPDSTERVSRDCDELQALIIEEARVMIAGLPGPGDDTEVLRDGDDFSCGDTVTFTFEYLPVPIALNISQSVN